MNKVSETFWYVCDKKHPIDGNQVQMVFVLAKTVQSQQNHAEKNYILPVTQYLWQALYSLEEKNGEKQSSIRLDFDHKISI